MRNWKRIMCCLVACTMLCGNAMAAEDVENMADAGMASAVGMLDETVEVPVDGEVAERPAVDMMDETVEAVPDADGAVVEVSVTEDMAMDGAATFAARADVLDVSVPGVLAIHLNADGTVTVGEGQAVTNNGANPVRVTNIMVTGENGWTVMDYSNTPDEGGTQFALQVNGTGIPATGMITYDGAEIGSGGSEVFEYAAKVSAGYSGEKVRIGTVVYTVEPVEIEPLIADYAVLYSDGTLAFQNGTEPKGDHGTVVNSWAGEGGWATTPNNSLTAVPWDGSRSSIVNVDVVDMIHPVSTAFWFYGCSNLVDANLSNLYTDKTTNMNCMFYQCSKLGALDISHFDTSSVTNMSNMFYMCRSLGSLDVSCFDTSNVTNMGGMFGDLRVKELDLTSFDTHKVTNMASMFSYSSSLQTVYVSESFVTGGVTSHNNMFFNATRIVGGNGTAYSTRLTNKTYARIDKPGQPGYFTAGPSVATLDFVANDMAILDVKIPTTALPDGFHPDGVYDIKDDVDVIVPGIGDKVETPVEPSGDEVADDMPDVPDVPVVNDGDDAFIPPSPDVQPGDDERPETPMGEEAKESDMSPGVLDITVSALELEDGLMAMFIIPGWKLGHV